MSVSIEKNEAFPKQRWYRIQTLKRGFLCCSEHRSGFDFFFKIDKPS
jgi:hypothetical protein